METLYLILAIVWSILCIILFFKIWGMTNDVKEIKDHLLYSQTMERDNASLEQQKNTLSQVTIQDIKVGDKVVDIDSEETLRIVKILNNEYCICQMWDLREKKFPISKLRIKENKE